MLRTRASLAAALLALVATLGLCILSYVEHSKNIRPSSIINAYLLLTLPFDAAQLRTRWLRGDNLAGNRVASSILAVKLLVLISEATEKTRILFTPYIDRSPEATSGLYSRGLFWWLNPLFRLGFRNVVNEDDLFPADGDLLSTSLEIRFSRHWANRMSSVPPVFLCPSTDTLYRQEIPRKAHFGLDHVTHDVEASCSFSATAPSVDILSIHAAPTYQQHHQACERP